MIYVHMRRRREGRGIPPNPKIWALVVFQEKEKEKDYSRFHFTKRWLLVRPTGYRLRMLETDYRVYRLLPSILIT